MRLYQQMDEPPDRVLTPDTAPTARVGSDNAELIRRALAGGSDGRAAWDTLVERNARAVWKVLWSYRLSPADREDAFQSTWVKAVEHLDQVREPHFLHVWLMTTARREAERISRETGRVLATDDIDDQAEVTYPVDTEQLEAAERIGLARAVLARLDERCRTLVRLLTIERLGYRQIEEAMGWQPGGTAIRRDRCLKKLRAMPEVVRYLRALAADPTDPTDPTDPSTPSVAPPPTPRRGSRS